MNDHNEQMGRPHPDHRTFDEFDVSKAMQLPYTNDEMAIIETVMASQLLDDKTLISDESITDTAVGFTIDDCGNRRMQATIMDEHMKTIATIDVTAIVDTLFTILQGLMNGRLRKLQNSYDLRHHCGIYADEAEA